MQVKLNIDRIPASHVYKMNSRYESDLKKFSFEFPFESEKQKLTDPALPVFKSASLNHFELKENHF